MAETVSLAVLENLVHIARQDFPTGYVVVAATMPDGIRLLTEKDLMARFRGADQRRIGEQWIESGDSAVLMVRSTVVPFEHNFLLNPKHRDFRSITAEPPVPFVFDEHLFSPKTFEP